MTAVVIPEYRRPKPFDRSRYVYPRFSQGEYERRWNLTREMMKSKNLDCLLVTGMSYHWDKGWQNVRYMTNYLGSLDSPCYVVLGHDAEPTVCTVTSQIDRVARSVVSDIRCSRNNLATAIGRIKELHAERGNIGLVSPNWNLQLPYDQMEYLKSSLPQAKISMVFEDFMKNVRWIKSSEEIKWVEKAAHLGDLMQEALVKNVKPGITEHEIWALVLHTVLVNGGEDNMALMSTNNTYDSDCPDTRVRPMERAMQKGYILNMENGPSYNGYEAQTGHPICIGEPNPEYRHMFDVCLEAYKRVSDQLRVGRTEDDIARAGQIIYDSGYCQIGAPLCHGMSGGVQQDGPVVSVQRSDYRIFQPVEIKPNTVWTVEISVATKDEMKGVFMADTFLATEGGSAPCRLQKYPTQLTIV
ncbi:MAG: aminopeptidase P family protein [Nitrososphaerota archaeon]|nr:aminopeptidase P family protein [Nitrososphaerota archaeon]